MRRIKLICKIEQESNTSTLLRNKGSRIEIHINFKRAIRAKRGWRCVDFSEKFNFSLKLLAVHKAQIFLGTIPSN